MVLILNHYINHIKPYQTLVRWGYRPTHIAFLWAALVAGSVLPPCQDTGTVLVAAMITAMGIKSLVSK